MGKRQPTEVGEAILGGVLLVLAFAAYQGYHWYKDRQAQDEAWRIERLPPQYGQWSNDLNFEASRTMNKNGFEGHWARCGVMRFKTDFNHPGRYLVRCSDIGKEWVEYLVDTKKGTVSGPDRASWEND